MNHSNQKLEPQRQSFGNKNKFVKKFTHAENNLRALNTKENISDAIFHIEGSPNFGDDNSMIMDIEP